MTLKSTVTSLTHTAVSTAVNAARHPLGTTAQAAGLVKETAGAGIGLVRNRIGGAPKPAPAPTQDSPAGEKAAVPAQKTPAEKPAEVPPVEKVQAKPAAKKAPAKPTAKKAPAKPAAKKAAAPADTEDPRDHIPGPDLAAFPPPAPEDLPEPIVIEAE